jgi:acyl carrier protein
MKEVGIKDPTIDKIISSLVEDSIHLVEIKLALENEFSSSVNSHHLIIDEKDMQDILKMNLSELSVYLEKLILIKNLPGS